MSNIELAVKYLLDGHPVIFPTDTVYGLAAIPEKNAIERLYILKNRSHSKKIIALISDKKYISMITDEKIDHIVDKFLPGPLSIICTAKGKFKELIGETIGIRIPDNELARNIIRRCGGILMTTSANISGEKSPKYFEEISKELLNNVIFFIKSKYELSGMPSTIISMIDNKCELIREGQIKFEDIKLEVNKFEK